MFPIQTPPQPSPPTPLGLNAPPQPQMAAPATPAPRVSATETAHTVQAPAPLPTTPATTPIEPNQLNFGTAHDPSQLQAASRAVQEQIRRLATQDPARFERILSQVYGDKLSPEMRQQLTQQAQVGTFPMPANLRFVAPEVLNGSAAGYSPENGGTVFVSADYRNNPVGLAGILMAEVGHHIDAQLGGTDSPGDEGYLLDTALQQGTELSPEQLETGRMIQDKSTIRVDGRDIEVENAAPLLAGAWVAKIAADTALDGALDIAIAAISGMPPPGIGTHVGNAIVNAIPILGEWNTARKATELVNAGRRAIQGLNYLRRVPGGEQMVRRLETLLADAGQAANRLDADEGKRLIKQFLSELGDAQRVARGVRSGSLRLGGTRDIVMNPTQLQSKFKHAQDFGVSGNYNPANREAFRAALQRHVDSPDTILIEGVYGRGNIPVTHYYNPVTQNVVMKDRNTGEFISGWRVGADAREHLLSTGRLGGGS